MDLSIKQQHPSSRIQRRNAVHPSSRFLGCAEESQRSIKAVLEVHTGPTAYWDTICVWDIAACCYCCEGNTFQTIQGFIFVIWKPPHKPECSASKLSCLDHCHLDNKCPLMSPPPSFLRPCFYALEEHQWNLPLAGPETSSDLTAAEPYVHTVGLRIAHLVPRDAGFCWHPHGYCVSSHLAALNGAWHGSFSLNTHLLVEFTTYQASGFYNYNRNLG